MKRHILSPRDAAWLTATIDANKARFGGWSMKDDGTPDGAGDQGKAAGTPPPKSDDKPAGDKPDGKADDGKKGDEPLGPGGLKALEAEREGRKALEKQLADFKQGLASLAGVEKPEGDKTADTLATVQQQIADMKHENAVLQLANTHGITDADDLAILKATKDPEALTKLAARLAQAGGSSRPGGKPGTPKPDGTQGSGDPAETKPSVARGRELFAARRGAKATTTDAK